MSTLPFETPDLPAQDPPAFEVGDFSDDDLKLWNSLVERYPSLNEAVPILREMQEEIFQVFGVDSTRAQEPIERMLLEDVKYLCFEDRMLSLEKYGGGGDFYSRFRGDAAHVAALEVRADSKGSEPAAKIVNAMVQNSYEVCDARFPASRREQIGTALPTDFMIELLKIGRELRIAQETYEPASRLITAEALGADNLNTDAIFAYDSVAVEKEARADLVGQHAAAQEYGRALKELIKHHGADSVMDIVKGSGDQVENVCVRLGLQTSEWTKDGAWALWDLAKNIHYQRLPTEGRRRHAQTLLDHNEYLMNQYDVTRRDHTVDAIAARQLGWELLENIRVGTLGTATIVEQVLEALSLEKAEGYNALAIKLRELYTEAAEGARDDMHFKASELSVLGKTMQAIDRTAHLYGL